MRMFHQLLFSGLAFFGLVIESQAANLASASTDIIPWARAAAPNFGCAMEKNFAYRYPHFNCALKRYRNKGDPCKNPDAYYEGPVFPQSLIQKIHPLVTNVTLSWEHGELQGILLTLKGQFSDSEIRRAFKLPLENALPENVMRIDIGHENKGLTDIYLMGFDHMGAGDVDCSAK
jgi:hypothetical protein